MSHTSQVIKLEADTLRNQNYRFVTQTTSKMQLVLMSLFAGQEIGEEVHPDSDQFIRVERGNVVVSLNDSEYELQDGEAIIVPRGTSHNVVALADTKLYTIYSPATHPDGLVEEFQEFEN